MQRNARGKTVMGATATVLINNECIGIVFVVGTCQAEEINVVENMMISDMIYGDAWANTMCTCTCKI